METATNPQTGEKVYLAPSGEWKPLETASNPKTGERVYLNETGAWEPMQAPAEPRQPNGTFGEGASGFVEGIGQAADMAAQILPQNAARNFVRGVGGLVNRGLEAVTDEPYQIPLPDAATPGTDAVQMIQDSDFIPGFDRLDESEDPTFARRAGRAGGNMLPFLPLGGPAQAVKSLGTSLIAGSGAVVGEDVGSDAGGEGGRALAEWLGLDPETGEAVGETVGGVTGAAAGGLGPSALGAATRGGTKALLSLPGDESAARYAASKAADVKPTPGSVGNSLAARIETTSALNPLSTGSVNRTHAGQVAATEAAVGRVADTLRAGATPANGSYQLGRNVQNMATKGLDRVRRELDDLAAREIAAQGGAKRVIPVKKLEDWARKTTPTVAPTQQRAIQTWMDDLGSMKQPIDKALHRQLTARIGADRAILDAGDVPKAKIDAARARIKDAEAKIDRNMGVSVEQLENQRGTLGVQTSTGPGVKQETANEAYGSLKQDQYGAARTSGTPGALDDFQRATARKRDLIDKETPLDRGRDKPTLEALVKTKPQSAYKRLVQEGNTGELKVLKRNTSNPRTGENPEWDAFAGDVLEEMGQPTSQTGRAANLNTDNFSPTEFATKYQNLRDNAPETLDLLFPNPGIRRELDEIVEVSKGLMERGKNANPSGTAATAITATGGMALGAGAMTGNLAPVVGLGLGAAAAQRAFMTEALAKVIGKQYPRFGRQMLADLPRQGAGGASYGLNNPEGED